MDLFGPVGVGLVLAWVFVKLPLAQWMPLDLLRIWAAGVAADICLPA